ncbi:hypothetical protein E2C01_024807 [Portunus trituberculatus]|uniref:Uncharacterized protein n=1 Tax=Portunus trituberculatus TaxID=210409 RepID=A0A5B7EDS8_PORTR|nr:hypothetical protein [Portunus trituberculatus]
MHRSNIINAFSKQPGSRQVVHNSQAQHKATHFLKACSECTKGRPQEAFYFAMKKEPNSIIRRAGILSSSPFVSFFPTPAFPSPRFLFLPNPFLLSSSSHPSISPPSLHVSPVDGPEAPLK